MPGLTVNTDGTTTSVPQTPVPVPVPGVFQAGRGPVTGAATGPPIAPPNRPVVQTTSSTPIVPPPRVNAQQQTPAAVHTTAISTTAATTTTATTATTPAPNPRSSSPPPRPAVSPITPPLKPQQFPPPRQTHAYSTQPAQAVIAPPAPEPIEFDTNPDVLALKSTLSILQMQGARARRDMVALQKAKTSALDDPKSFLADLKAGSVRVGAPEMGGGLDDDDDDSDSSSDEDEGDAGVKPDVEGPAGATAAGQPTVKSEPDSMDVDGPATKESRPWSNLPEAQNIYRMPPINWGQYAVAGESLEKLHKEQVVRPPQGSPATVTPDGRFEFKAGGRQEEHIGIAAPYNPLRDKLDKKKPKAPNRQG